MKLAISKTRAHTSWACMKQRCNNPNAPGYHKYGGRGIKVCERWNLFVNFYADMGERPEGMTLDRINNNGNYEPQNCRWATPLQQSANQRPNPRAVPPRDCAICQVTFTPPGGSNRDAKHCSRKCYFVSMIAHERGGKSVRPDRVKQREIHLAIKNNIINTSDKYHYRRHNSENEATG